MTVSAHVILVYFNILVLVPLLGLSDLLVAPLVVVDKAEELGWIGFVLLSKFFESSSLRERALFVSLQGPPHRGIILISHLLQQHLSLGGLVLVRDLLSVVAELLEVGEFALVLNFKPRTGQG